ncbi:glycosyltransferase family 4 protein [Acidobacteriota bacterium]
MKILLFALDFKPRPGGLAEYGFQIANRLAEKGHCVTALTVGMPGSRSFDIKQKYRTVRVARTRWIREVLFFIVIAYYAVRGRIDVVLCLNWFPCAALMAFLGPLFKIPYYTFAFGAEIYDSASSLKRRFGWIKQSAFGRSARCFPISRFTGELLTTPDVGVSPSRISVVPGATDPGKFRPAARSWALRCGSPVPLCFPGEDAARLDDREIEARWYRVMTERRVILTVTRLVENKGIDLIIRALPDIRSMFPRACYLIVGDGPDKIRLQKLAQVSWLHGHVFFAGYVPDEALVRFYNLAEVFIMPSRQRLDSPAVEGFGLVFLEANGCGKPVIGGRSGGMADAVIHGVTGFLVDPADPDEAGTAVCRLLGDQDLAASLGKKGRNRVCSELNWDSVGQRIAAVIERECEISGRQ